MFSVATARFRFGFMQVFEFTFVGVYFGFDLVLREISWFGLLVVVLV